MLTVVKRPGARYNQAMEEAKKRDQWWSFAGVIILALILPGFLKLANSITRYFTGAEGRLAAVTVDIGRPLGQLPAPWEALAQGSDNLKGFTDGINDQLTAVKPEYIRIDHIYDAFNVVGRDSNGGLTFNWADLDNTIKKITATGAMPFLSLSYMPTAISSGDNLAPPKNWNEWAGVVQKTVEHVSGDLALNNVYYEVWNEPDLFGKWTMGGSKDYRTLYRYAVSGAIKAQRVKPFKIGGPATTGLYKSWIDNFFPFILSNHLRLDFFSWHRYDLNLAQYEDDINNVDNWLESQPYFANVEKIISEMGPNSEMGKENDTQVGAAHMVATARTLMFNVKYGFNFAISGYWGMVGKPRFKALNMLASLGKNRLSLTGEGSWVRAIGATDNKKYQVLLVNYDPKGSHRENVPVSFVGLTQKNYNLTTSMLDGGKYSADMATTASFLQTIVPMEANSVAMVELTPK